MLLITGGRGEAVRVYAHRTDLINLEAQIRLALIDGQQVYEYEDEVGEMYELEVNVLRGEL